MTVTMKADKNHRISLAALLTGLLMMSSLVVTAQTDKAAYLNRINEQYPGADIVEFEVKEGYVEIEFLYEGAVYEVGMDSNKDVIYREEATVVPADVLPKIERKLAESYVGWTVDEYAKVTRGDTAFYKVELMKEGVEENVYFSLEGKYFKLGNVVVDEPWTKGDLLQLQLFASAPYDFLRPAKTFELPELLREVSGIARDTDGTLLCVQDELGVVFRFDPKKERLQGMYRFADVGDFEDIAINGQKAYVLRSDGAVFTFDTNDYDGTVTQTIVPLPSMNMEGLFLHSSGKELLFASKEDKVGGTGWQRAIYSQRLKKGARPVEVLSIDQLALNDNLAKAFPAMKGKQLQLNPSALAIHPLTGDWYVLSATNRLLAVYSQGQLMSVYPLPAEVYYKPEGMTFCPNGDLYLSSEGMKNGYIGGEIYYLPMR
ncbi:MAG: hypothetical protein BWY72_01045 [Bacteroidetes bacterium ADurb.Bin416]|jgi:hypothetical protein|nr:MAG: hypothetical protein BWY72_01045 [Bacteroidetes bacterium ADurb.Bin416]